MMHVCGEAAELVVELNHHPEVFQVYLCYSVPGFKNALQRGLDFCPGIPGTVSL